LNKKVIISVKGTQLDMENEMNRLELVTEGKYYKKNNNYYVTYAETEVTGMEGTTTTLKISDNTVTLMRFGIVNSQMVFEKGQKHVSYYDTAYGAFTVGVIANEVNVKADDSSAEINIGYQVEVDNNRTGLNNFSIVVRESGAALKNSSTLFQQS
jgi:Uncharacterized protein conserved in bacteria